MLENTIWSEGNCNEVEGPWSYNISVKGKSYWRNSGHFIGMTQSGTSPEDDQNRETADRGEDEAHAEKPGTNNTGLKEDKLRKCCLEMHPLGDHWVTENHLFDEGLWPTMLCIKWSSLSYIQWLSSSVWYLCASVSTLSLPLDRLRSLPGSSMEVLCKHAEIVWLLHLCDVWI